MACDGSEGVEGCSPRAAHGDARKRVVPRVGERRVGRRTSVDVLVDVALRLAMAHQDYAYRPPSLPAGPLALLVSLRGVDAQRTAPPQRGRALRRWCDREAYRAPGLCELPRCHG